MKNLTLFVLLAIVTVSSVYSQNSRFLSVMESYPDFLMRTEPSAEIRNIQSLDTGFGIAFTGDSLFITYDGGTSWSESKIGLAGDDSIGSVIFRDRLHGFAIVSSSKTYSRSEEHTSELQSLAY